jgi:uncharacterized protein (TIGR04255 family)
VNLEFVKAPLPSRYWFLTDDKAELLQFQPDRFIQNWRKIESSSRAYPRFEAMIARYFDNLENLSAYAEQKGLGAIVPNQCEVTYINQLSARDANDDVIPAAFYFSPLGGVGEFKPDDLRCTFRKEIKNDEGEAVGRFIVEIADAWTAEGESIYRMTLVGRGAPPTPDLAGCRHFMESVRLGISDIFLATTTKEAQKIWGRVS